MKKNKSILLSAPYILWMLAFTLIPLGVVGYFALTDPDTGAFTWGNIRELGTYLPVFGESVLYSLVSAVICLLIGYPVAYYIAHRGQFMQKMLYMLVMLPMCMSFLLRTLAWVALLQDTGIINNLLESLGLARMKLIRTPGAVILGMVYDFLPYMVLPIYTSMNKLDKRYLEAAADLGCNSRKTLFRVILPLTMPGIVSGVTMVFVPSISTFYISQKLGGGSFDLIGDTIERQFQNAVTYHTGAAISLVMMILIFISLAVMNKFSDGGEDIIV